MAKYTSSYKGLLFVADGRLHKFSNGEFHTEDEKVIAELENVLHAEKVEEDEEKPKRKGKKTEEAAE